MRSFLTTLLLFAFSLMVFGQDTKLYIVTHIDAEPNFTTDALHLLHQFSSDSRKDPGAVSIEILEETARPNHFTVVEVWQNQKAYESHLVVAHTKQFRAKLLPMLGSPFDERLHRLVP